MTAAMIWPAVMMPSVYPSLSARATASLPSVPPAPGRFSITTGWPSFSCSDCATMRPMMSAPPPGPNGTIMRRGVGRAEKQCGGDRKQAASRQHHYSSLGWRRALDAPPSFMIPSAGFIQSSCFAGYEPSKPVHVIWWRMGDIEDGEAQSRPDATESPRTCTLHSDHRRSHGLGLLINLALSMPSQHARRSQPRGSAMNLLPDAKASSPILAAGGIVLGEGSKPRIAIVRLRRDKSWVLPKGKLYPGEPALAAARREVLEETGHEVSVHGFLGSMLYSVDGRIKIVQFWHMRAIGGRRREPMDDIKSVKWVSLKQAVEILTRAHEKVFLANVGPVALKAAKQSAREKSSKPWVSNKDTRRGQSARVAPTAH